MRAVQALLAAVVVVALGTIAWRRTERGRFAAEDSTWGAGHDGARGFYEVLVRRGFQVERWARDLSALPEGVTLIQLGSCDEPRRRPMMPPEQAALMRWVERGGHVVVAGISSPGPVLGTDVIADAPPGDECFDDDTWEGRLFAAIQRRGADQDGRAEPLGETIVPEPSGPLAGVGPIPASRVSALVPPAGDHSVLARTSGKPTILRIRVGAGTVTVVGSSSFLRNGGMADGTGAVGMVRLLRATGPNRLLFDEYHLGAGATRSTMGYLLEQGFGAVLLQGLIVIAVLLARASTRLGAVIRPRAEGPRSMTFLAGIESLFRKVADVPATIALLSRRARTDIARAHRIDGDPDRLAERLALRGRTRAAAAVKALADLGTTDVLEASRTIDRLTAEALLEAHRRDG